MMLVLETLILTVQFLTFTLLQPPILLACFSLAVQLVSLRLHGFWAHERKEEELL